jgi:hypothetical protein
MSTLLEDAEALSAIPTAADHPLVHDKINALILKMAVAVTALGAKPEVATETLVKLIGQSNGDGQALKTDLPAGYTSVIPNVSIYTPFTKGFQPLEGGVNSATEGTNNWGSEMAFMPRLAQALGKRVYLDKYCYGGTQLAVGAGDDWNATSTGELLDKSNANSVAARAALGSHPVPLAIIFDQGESDANETNAAGYKANLKALIAKEREFFGAPVPFLIMQLSTSQTFLPATYLAIVRQAQAEVSQEVVGCILISSEGLGMDTPKLHYTAPALLTRGNRIGDALIAIANGTRTPVTTPPTVTGDDLANTIAVGHPYGIANTEVQAGSSSAFVAYTTVPGYNASNGKIDVGNVAQAAGYLKFRTKADTDSGRTASASVNSPAFTVTATARSLDPTSPELFPSADLSSAFWSTTSMSKLAGQPDGDGGNSGVLLRPGASGDNNRNVYSDSFELAAGNKAITVRGIPAGFDFIEILVLRQPDFTLATSVLVNLATGEKSSGSDTATVASVAGGAYRARLPFAWPGGSLRVFIKVWATADKSDYVTDNVKGVNLYRLHLEAV